MMYTASACNLGETGEKDCLENIFSYIGNSNASKKFVRVYPVMLFCKKGYGQALCQAPKNFIPLCS